MGERSYLDWNAGAPLLPEVLSEVQRVLGEAVGNPSSVHAEGRRARAQVETVRAEVARLVGASDGDVVFTSGGAEANAAALHGFLELGGEAAPGRLALSGVEHPSVLETARELQRRGADVRRLRVHRDGLIDVAGLEKLLASEKVDVVCVQLANSETGVVQAVGELAELAHRHGARLHCDAVQGAGKLDVASVTAAADTVSLSAHKIGGLPGTGALVVRGAVELSPLIPGVQEHRRRGGTENLTGIVSFGVAARLARERASQWRAVARLRDALERELQRGVGGVTIYGAAAPRLPNTSCVGFPAPCTGAVVVAALDLSGFAVSSGSACSSGVERGSAVVEAMGYDEDSARRTVRVSLGPSTGEDETRAFCDAVVRAVNRMKGGQR